MQDDVTLPTVNTHMNATLVLDTILRPNVQRNVITPLNSNFNPFLPLSICSAVNVDVLSELLCYHPDR